MADKNVECRVICDGPFGRINDIVTVPQSVADANQGGYLDSHKSALAAVKGDGSAPAKPASRKAKK